MFDKNLTKPKLTFLVNKYEGDLVDTGSLTDTATGAINLAPLQLGLINKSTSASDAGGAKIPLDEFIDGTDNTIVVPQIKIVQGTSTSANPPADNRPGVKRAVEGSAVIQADEKIWINIKKAKAATYSIVGVSNINVDDEVEYRFRVAFFGRYHDIMYSCGHVSTPVYSPYYNSPDYSQLIADGVLTGNAEALDHLVKNLVVEVNKNSDAFSFPQINKGGQQLVAAFAIGDGAASGTVTVAANNTTITSVTVGTVTLTAGVAFVIGGTNLITATNIANAINANATLTALGVVASAAAGVVTIQAPGAAANTIALAVVGADLAASGATLTGGFGIGISTLSPNVPVPIFAYNGPNGVVTKSYVFNAEEVASLQSAYPGLETIVLADASSIQDVQEADKIAFLGLDRPEFLAEDRLKEKKVRIEVGLTSGFNTNTVTTATLSNAFEGFGYPHQVKTWYVETQERRDNDIQFRGVGLQKIQYPSDVLDITVPQDVVIITHSTTKQGAIGTRDVNLQATVILTDADVDGNGLATGVLGANTADVPTAVEEWARTNRAFVQVTYDA
jgi:hypothetical protein